MDRDIAAAGPTSLEPNPPPKASIYRHSAIVRVTHWVNLLCMTVLLMSGLQIFNAHPALYIGEDSRFDDPVLSMRAVRQPDGRVAGVTRILDARFDTTGVLGLSQVGDRWAARGFPSCIS